MRRKLQVRDDVDDALLDACELAVRAARCCALTKLGGETLSPRARQLVIDGMIRRGLERVGAKMRVPVGEQLAPLVGAEPVPVAALKRRLVGCSDREIKAALQRGTAWSLVQRGKSLAVVARSDGVLSETELAIVAALARDMTALAKSVKQKSGAASASLWRADLNALLDPAAALRRPPSRLDAGPGPVIDRVFQSIAQSADHKTGLASVPHVLRALSPHVSSEAAREALLALARAGRIELRPESGVGLLTPELLALCPTGPRGSVLSYARILSPAPDSLG